MTSKPLGLLRTSIVESVSNSFRVAEWKLRKFLNLKKQTIVPVKWNAQLFHQSHLPTQQFKDSLPPESRIKLSTIIEELKIISKLSIRFPEKLNDKEWKILLECQTRKQRFDHILFLYQIGKLREKTTTKRSEMKEVHRSRKPYEYSLVFETVYNSRIYEEIKSLNTYQLNNKPTIAIDCQFLPKLSPRGQQLTASQLQYLINDNRNLNEPFKLYFVNYNEKLSSVYCDLKKKKLSALNSKHNINPQLCEESVSEIFDPKKIVYLSPDGEETLETVDDDKVYVIGGIVDRVFEKDIGKHASKDAAIRENVKYAKLPIDQYIDFKSGSKFLTILAVVNILNDVNNHGNWEKALMKWIPNRNTKNREEKSQGVIEKYRKIREFNWKILEIVEKKLGKDFK